MLFRKKHKAEPFTVTVPDPCKQNWNEMNVVDDVHRHCDSCAKNVVDFSNMSDDELVLFFRHSNQHICGRFRKDQVNRPMTLLPETSRRSSWWKAAMLLPLTLFVKSAGAQQNDSLIAGDSLTVQNDTLVHVNDSIAIDSAVVQNDSVAIDDDTIQLTIQAPQELTVVTSIMSWNPGGYITGFCSMPIRQEIIMGDVAPPPPTLAKTGVDWLDSTHSSKPDQSISATTSVAYSENPPAEPKEAPVPPPIPSRPWYEAILPERFRIRKA